jgi:hypothetical protein
MLDRARVPRAARARRRRSAGLVVYDRDPVADLHMLGHPAHVVLGGRLAGP